MAIEKTMFYIENLSNWYW